ncbi:MAG: hypothetical protein HeimC3_30300 [Candidatus Heimdallarchaeota archaeon LC_3]|nr:MAG: hypothetical protein HeimC3_30300 [Candidatus Heimdallarchaeota archaeon LC_3]
MRIDVSRLFDRLILLLILLSVVNLSISISLIPNDSIIKVIPPTNDFIKAENDHIFLNKNQRIDLSVSCTCQETYSIKVNISRINTDSTIIENKVNLSFTDIISEHNTFDLDPGLYLIEVGLNSTNAVLLEISSSFPSYRSIILNIFLFSLAIFFILVRYLRKNL